MQNLISLGSILYHAFLDLFRKNIKPDPNSQDNIKQNHKINSRSAIEALDVDLQNPLEDDIIISQKNSEEAIVGFYSQDQMKELFKDGSYPKALTEILDSLNERLFKLVSRHYIKDYYVRQGFPTFKL